MLNIRDLEKRWLHYKIKSYLPYAVIGISLIVITTIVMILANKINETGGTKKEIKVTASIEKEKIQTAQKRTTPAKEKTSHKEQQKAKVEETRTEEIKNKPMFHAETEEKLLLKPSMSFLKNIQNQQQEPGYQERKPLASKRKTVQTAPIKEEYFSNEQQIQKRKTSPQNTTTQKEVETQKSVITIERRDSQKDIDDIIKRFKKNNNPALSLFVAKKYYELGDYEQSYNYALITNGIDNNIEDSWLIFAKSLVKLKKREMAIKTLREYINYSHSGNAKILLDDIKTGKFQ